MPQSEATLARATMLRTSANALWSRFVPAARQHIAGAGAASASRVRLHARPMRGRAFPTARQALSGFRGSHGSSAHTRFDAVRELTFPPPHTRSARSCPPPSPARRTNTRSMSTRYVRFPSSQTRRASRASRPPRIRPIAPRLGASEKRSVSLRRLTPPLLSVFVFASEFDSLP